MKAFLSHEDITDEPDLERRTALMWAAGKGADDVIKVMMQYGGDIDATDNTGATGEQNMWHIMKYNTMG